MSRTFTLTTIVVVGAAMLLGACSQNNNLNQSKQTSAVSGNRPMKNVRTTAYTGSEGGKHAWRVNAIGSKLKENQSKKEQIASAAADWSRFPLGTKFRIEGTDRTFMIDDYGSALVGTNTIDLYMPTRSSMNRWGVRHVNIEVMEQGSFEKSLDILKPRARVSYVRKMVKALEQKS
jgi:3D (Asp-Asp-Asp) domain-containing protein